MKNSRIARTAAVAAVLFATIGANAQSEASSKSIPLHVEASLGACTPSNKVLPLDVNVDLNYTFAKRFSLHATTTTSYFMPKNGATHDYNRATNLGGGLGYVFLPEKDDQLGDFELRAFVTTSVGSSDFKNTSYNVGVHWFGHTEKHRLVPTVGVGYTLRDFSAKGMKNINGAYFSLGLRF